MASRDSESDTTRRSRQSRIRRSEARTMSDMQIVDTLRPRSEMADTFVAVRGEALFGSVLQPSESPDPEQVRRAVTATLRRLGLRGCSAHVAGEFGDHPDTAVTRM